MYPQKEQRNLRFQQNTKPAVVLVSLLAAVLLLTVWTTTIHKDGRGRAVQHIAPPPARFSLQGTSYSWYGQPVYQLTNETNAVLKQVVLRSWSENRVPILAIGKLSTVSLQETHPLNVAAANLTPGESIWFAASHQRPYKLTVFWDHDGRAAYQIYTSKDH